jgi:hypothetical protein
MLATPETEVEPRRARGCNDALVDPPIDEVTDMKIKIRIKNNFGNEAIYPVCQAAQVFAGIAGTKTLTRATIESIQSLGYEIEIAQQTLRGGQR